MGTLQQPCACGSSATYDACCGRLHRGADRGATAEELMRSRYSAYATGHVDHLFRSWHPRTRPADLTLDAGVTWTGLRVLSTTDGGPDDQTGTVEFEARYETASGPGVLRELSRFERGGRAVGLRRRRRLGRLRATGLPDVQARTCRLGRAGSDVRARTCGLGRAGSDVRIGHRPHPRRPERCSL